MLRKPSLPACFQPASSLLLAFRGRVVPCLPASWSSPPPRWREWCLCGSLALWAHWMLSQQLQTHRQGRSRTVQSRATLRYCCKPLPDKFAAVDAGVCSRACSEVEECSHWTFGQQYGVKTCFLRKSDAGQQRCETLSACMVRLLGRSPQATQPGRAFLPHWVSGTSDCAPPRLPPAWVALRTAKCEGLRACDAGKGEGCPDVTCRIQH